MVMLDYSIDEMCRSDSDASNIVGLKLGCVEHKRDCIIDTIARIARGGSFMPSYESTTWFGRSRRVKNHSVSIGTKHK